MNHYKTEPCAVEVSRVEAGPNQADDEPPPDAHPHKTCV